MMNVYLFIYLFTSFMEEIECHLSIYYSIGFPTSGLVISHAVTFLVYNSYIIRK